MRCKQCGHDNPDKNLVCAGCYQVLGAPAALPAAAAPAPVAPSALPGRLVLELDKPHFTIPDGCACCLGNAVDQVKVIAQKRTYNFRRSLVASLAVGRGTARFDVETTSWHFPYCLTCVDHLRARTRAGWLGFGLGLAAAALFAWAARPLDGPRWAAAVAVLVGGSLLASAIIRGQLARRGPACTSTGPAVTARARGDGYRLSFANAAYGEELERINTDPKRPAHLQHHIRRV